jgi:hypothetical protein
MFGPYELRSLIGVGGMGEVYQAYDTVKDRVVGLSCCAQSFPPTPASRSDSAANPGSRHGCRSRTSSRSMTGFTKSASACPSRAAAGAARHPGP